MDIIFNKIYKKTLIGNNKYLFLINDSNDEIKQHYLPDYTHKLNLNSFNEYIKKNNEIANKNNFKYNFFIIPDKSVVCQNFLPFFTSKPNKIIDKLSQINIPDFTDHLDSDCYFKSDSHINFIGGLKFVQKIFEYLNLKLDESKYKKFLKITNFTPGDLLSNDNWGDLLKEKKSEYIESDSFSYENISSTSNAKNLPVEFKYVFLRETQYIINDQAETNFKLLIFRDSSSAMLTPFLSLYFKEIILYWDHWYFNIDLINYFKPDYVFEIRTERFLNVNLRDNLYEPHYKNNLSTDNIDLITKFLSYSQRLCNINNISEIILNNQFYSQIASFIHDSMLTKSIPKNWIDINNSNFLIFNQNNIEICYELNKDLKNLSEFELIHFILHNNRKYKYDNIPDDFNWKSYIELNNDFNFTTEVEAKYHYEKIGYKENRKYKYDNIPDDFNWKSYIELNNDFNFTTELEAKYHYEKIGYKENRKYKYDNIPDDFNWKSYIELNNDFNFTTELEAKYHYEKIGYKKNKKYKYDNISDDFNWKSYIELNNDFNFTTEVEAKRHYEYDGFREKRRYK